MNCCVFSEMVSFVLFLPVSAFADDLHLEVIDPTGCWDGVGGPDRRCIFWGFSVTFR